MSVMACHSSVPPGTTGAVRVQFTKPIGHLTNREGFMLARSPQRGRCRKAGMKGRMRAIRSVCLGGVVAMLAVVLQVQEAAAKPRLRMMETFSSTSKPHASQHAKTDEDAAQKMPLDYSDADSDAVTDAPILRPLEVDLPSFGGKVTPPEVVKVMDLPDAPEFQREDGSYVDLGWHFIGRSGGEWVGFIGSTTEYLTVSPEQLAAIMLAANITRLPDVPVRMSGRNKSTSQGSDRGWGTIGLVSTIMSVIAAFMFIRYLQWKAAIGAAFLIRRLLQWFRDPSGASWTAVAERQVASTAPGLKAKASSRPAAPSRSQPTAVVRSSTVVKGSPSIFGSRA